MRKNKSIEIVASNIRHQMALNSSADNQSKLSRKSGVAQATIGRILRQEVSPSIESLDAIASAFGVTTDTLMRSASEENNLPTSSSEFFEQHGDFLESLPLKELMKIVGRIESVVDKHLKMAEDKK